MTTGEHYSTFGGNPLVCAAAIATLDIIQKEKLVEASKKMGKYFRDRLSEEFSGLRLVKDIRGLGLMLAIELRLKNKDFILKAGEKGLLLLTSGTTTIRILPPLNILRAQIDKALTILKEIFIT